MDSTALHDLFRSDVRDQQAPYLWSSTEIYGYIDDAQKMFCRLTGGIGDASSAITEVMAEEGEEWAEIHPRILKIRAATRGSDRREMHILNHEDLMFRSTDDDYGLRRAFRLDDSTGKPEAIVTGMEANRVRVIPIPVSADTIELVVYRLPLIDITGPGQALEIDSQHHRHLLHWMKHLAHQKQDAETFDRGRAKEFEAAFQIYCDQAKQERERREHKYRTIAYGGL